MKTFLSRLRNHTSAGIVIICLSAIAMAQGAYDMHAPPFSAKLSAARRNLLPETLLPYISFGFNTFLADMYWLRTIQDFVAWNGKEGFFITYFKNISTLDPRFEHPYLFAIWTIPQNKQDLVALTNVTTIAERGIVAIPTSWKIPYNLGTQYYLFTKSYEKAKEYLRIAAEKKDAPLGVYLNYSSFVINNVQGYKASYDLVKVIYDTTTDETLKKVLALGIQEELLRTMLERAIVAYKTTKDVYPSSVEQLIQENLVALPSTFTNSFTVIINKRSGSFEMKERK